ncbi:glycine-rich protein DOT1-like [Diaphorina citri]|uniref:Glycine-rich protein DOT1-like n=1 Tax=Diaphorina citri TaxID=121845 RepID=A0A1S4EEF2_DIACI|nr:glycine-rich protein DOT1-like [Diaphorina citri]
MYWKLKIADLTLKYGDLITEVVACNTATVIRVNKSDIYLHYQYECRGHGGGGGWSSGGGHGGDSYSSGAHHGGGDATYGGGDAGGGGWSSGGSGGGGWGKRSWEAGTPTSWPMYRGYAGANAEE